MNEVMLLRRLGTSVPLAVLVAVLAHVAGFGRDHAPGAAHAIDLLAALGVALATLAGAVLIRAFTTTVRDGRPVARAVHSRSLGWYATRVGGLVALAAIAFLAIEAFEGNIAIDGSLRAIAALLPLAILVVFLSRRADGSLRALGARLGLALGIRIARDNGARSHHRQLTRVIAQSAVRAGARRGRAPPRIA